MPGRQQCCLRLEHKTLDLRSGDSVGLRSGLRCLGRARLGERATFLDGIIMDEGGFVALPTS